MRARRTRFEVASLGPDEQVSHKIKQIQIHFIAKPPRRNDAKERIKEIKGV